MKKVICALLTLLIGASLVAQAYGLEYSTDINPNVPIALFLS